MIADDQALQGPPIHLAPGSRGRAQIIAPYQPHGFTDVMSFLSKVQQLQRDTHKQEKCRGYSINHMGQFQLLSM